MKKLIPLVLAVFGTVAGAGAGYVLRGDAKDAPSDAHAAKPGGNADAKVDDGHGEAAEGKGKSVDGHGAADATGDHEGDTEHDENQPEYVKLNNQFVVPVVENGAVSAMVILSLSLEVAPGTTEAVYTREPKLRDVFLQVLFDHANSGGFRGTFTDGANLVVLRQALLEIAQRTLGDMVTDVLIVDIARQDT